MISLKERPIHLDTRLISVIPDYPEEGFHLEKLIMYAELDDRTIDVTLSLLFREDIKNFDVAIVDNVPKLVNQNTAYVIASSDDLIIHIGRQLQVQRRSKRSDDTITDWLIKRVGEYINSRIV